MAIYKKTNINHKMVNIDNLVQGQRYSYDKFAVAVIPIILSVLLFGIAVITADYLPQYGIPSFWIVVGKWSFKLLAANCLPMGTIIDSDIARNYYKRHILGQRINTLHTACVKARKLRKRSKVTPIIQP